MAHKALFFGCQIFLGLVFFFPFSGLVFFSPPSLLV